ncbi:hypothetical protein KCU93_g8416, partial [Aureobasidium melanogenum]
MLPWQTSPRNFFNYMLVRSEDGSEPEEDAAWAKERSKVRNARIISRTHYILVHGLFIISTVITVCSLVFLFHMNFSVTRRLPATVEPPYGNPLPQLPLQLKKFGPDEIFTEPPNDRSDAAWKALAGPTINEQGFIYIPNARELKLPAGLLREGGEMYGISMFHQLRCLGAIRNTFWKLMNGTLDPVEFSDIDGDTTAPDFVPNGRENDVEGVNWIKRGDDKEGVNWIKRGDDEEGVNWIKRGGVEAGAK